MIIDEENVLIHYGILRRSGRYPWGSHNNVAQRSMGFLDYVKDMQRQGLTESQIAKGIGEMADKATSVLDLRALKSIATNEKRAARIALVQRLRDKGNSPTAISRRTGIPEPTVRSYLAPGEKEKADILTNTANMLMREADKKTFLDVGKGVELNPRIGVSRTKMDTALAIAKAKGYSVHIVKIPQVTGSHETATKVLVPPGVTQKDAFVNRHLIQQITEFSEDGGKTFGRLHDPLPLDPKRVGVVYDSGQDGMIYVRPGVDDVSIGAKSYAQVRVAIGNDHYLKGMAIYKSGLPDGVDVEFHTSKSDTGNKLDAMKKNADEPGFAETGVHPLLKSVKPINGQIVADIGTPKERVTSVMNLVNEEGDWSNWSHNFSSQMLSKQRPSLAKSQLDLTYENRYKDLQEINALTNPTVRKRLLMDFANDADAAAVHLQAAALPRIGNHVILPSPTIKPTEIYAPNFLPGEKVALIRHPHAGRFEIPELTVNNNHRDSKKLIGNAKDAVGIHPSVAQWLSGADFDGDTVLVIPNNRNKIQSSKPLEKLKDFNPRREYPAYEGMKPMRNTQAEMGAISNLITDMSLRNAPNEELVRAVKHSMVVIDAEKHNLNYRQSARDNGIQQLKEKYQTGGASTLISRAGAKDYNVPDRKPRTMAKGGPINLETGELEWEPTGKLNRSKTGPKTIRVKRLALTNDARTLMSSPPTPMEILYANHSNKLKGLANHARLTAVKIPNPKQSPSAKKAYAPQVDSLMTKLRVAQSNAPLERQAQVIANYAIKARFNANKNLSDDAKKKIRYQSITQARQRTGANKADIQIDDQEWNAIQAGAVSNSKLNEILNHADMKTVRAHATPKVVRLMTPTRTSRAKSMLASGYTRAEVAQALGVSLSTLDLATKGE